MMSLEAIRQYCKPGDFSSGYFPTDFLKVIPSVSMEMIGWEWWTKTRIPPKSRWFRLPVDRSVFLLQGCFPDINNHHYNTIHKSTRRFTLGTQYWVLSAHLEIRLSQHAHGPNSRLCSMAQRQQNPLSGSSKNKQQQVTTTNIRVRLSWVCQLWANGIQCKVPIRSV